MTSVECARRCVELRGDSSAQFLAELRKFAKDSLANAVAQSNRLSALPTAVWLTRKLDSYDVNTVQQFVAATLDGRVAAPAPALEPDRRIRRMLETICGLVHYELQLNYSLLQYLCIVHVELQAAEHHLQILDVVAPPELIIESAADTMLFNYVKLLKISNYKLKELYDEVWSELLELLYYKDCLLRAPQHSTLMNSEQFQRLSTRVKKLQMQLEHKRHYIEEVNDGIQLDTAAYDAVQVVHPDRLLVNGKMQLFVQLREQPLHAALLSPSAQPKLFRCVAELANKHAQLLLAPSDKSAVLRRNLANLQDSIYSWLEIYRHLRRLAHSPLWRAPEYYSTAYRPSDAALQSFGALSKQHYFCEVLAHFAGVYFCEPPAKLKEMFVTSTVYLQQVTDAQVETLKARLLSAAFLADARSFIARDPSLARVNELAQQFDDYKYIYIKSWLLCYALQSLFEPPAVNAPPPTRCAAVAQPSPVAV